MTSENDIHYVLNCHRPDMEDVPSITFAGVAYSLPFAGLFRAHTGAERGALCADISEMGVVVPVVTYDSPVHGRSVLDGATRLSIASELDLAAVPIEHLGALSDAAAGQVALSLNASRRHLTLEEQSAARVDRIQRAVELKAAGLSTRQIAKGLGVSHTQVARDLAETVTPVTSADQNVKALYAAQAAVRRLSDLLDSLTTGPFASRFCALLARHHADGAIPALVAALADLAASAAQDLEE